MSDFRNLAWLEKMLDEHCLNGLVRKSILEYHTTLEAECRKFAEGVTNWAGEGSRIYEEATAWLAANRKEVN
jgi:hypothetical protein